MFKVIPGYMISFRPPDTYKTLFQKGKKILICGFTSFANPDHRLCVGNVSSAGDQIVESLLIEFSTEER